MLDQPDDLDGRICDGPQAPRNPPTPDGAWVLGFVLFADIDWHDPAAVEVRRLEWLELFGGPSRRGLLRRVWDRLRSRFGGHR